jgi:phosphoribosyl 1,2-cyclic phosphodiesterase
MTFELEFWGVRGSIACPSPEHVAYGGNTSCVAVLAQGQHLILDAGTGLRPLGNQYLRDGVRHARILLTHTHWDHISGFPFFAPGFQAGHRFEILSGHLEGSGATRQVLAGQMARPTFPVPLEAMHAELVFEDFNAGDAFTLEGGIRVVTAPLNHPNGATGYRIECSGKSLCYVTDTEHVIGAPDQKVLGLIEGADLVIYDSTYTDAEFEAHVGWGHSTWQEAVRLCRQANARQLMIFHHDPNHEDARMAEIEREARTMWPAAGVARERMRIQLA